MHKKKISSMNEKLMLSCQTGLQCKLNEIDIKNKIIEFYQTRIYMIVLQQKQKQHMLPEISKVKRKSIRFSNPLSGRVFNNHLFLKNCDYDVPAPEISLKISRHKRSMSMTKNERMLSKKVHSSQRRSQLQQSRNFTISHIFEDNEKSQPLSLGLSIVKKILFEDIQVKVLKVSGNSLEEHSIYVNMMHYFSRFFRVNLKDSIDKDFLDFVEPYIQSLIKRNKLSQPLNLNLFPDEIFTFKTKEQIKKKIEFLEQKSSQRYIDAVVRFYCVPSVEYRESCIRDIIFLITGQLKKTPGFNQNLEYALISKKGSLITDAIQIPFSERLLLLCEKEHYQEIYADYIRILDNSSFRMEKQHFTEGLKKSFREKIVKGNINDTEKNYQTIDANKQNLRIAQQKLSRKRSERSLKPHMLSYHQMTMNNSQKLGRKKIRKGYKQLSLLNKNEQSYEKQFNSFQSAENKNCEHQVHKKQILSKSPYFRNLSLQKLSTILSWIDISPKQEYISLQQWKRVRAVIDCEGDKQYVRKFMKNFLQFEAFQSMNKHQFYHRLKANARDSSIENLKALEEVLWAWFEKNDLIDDNHLWEWKLLGEWKERHRIVFEVFISIILQKNEASVLSLAHQLLL